MKKIIPIIWQDIFHPTRFFFALIFATIFVVLGYFTPRLYLQYIDTTEYYSVEKPVLVDKHIYKPCDTINTTFVRTSLVEGTAHGTVQLFLIDENEITKIKPLFDGNIVIMRTNKKTIHTSYILPCDIKNGSYYIQAIVKYQIQGIQKIYSWSTETFVIENALAK